MILPFGEWKGHPMGEESYSKAEAEQIVAYFNLVKERSGGKPLLIDYEHQSLNPALAGLIPAAGWIYSLTIGDDGVYGEVEWTDKAKQAIKDKELLSLSPVIATNDIDPVTGEVIPISLFNAGATNQPFMHDRMELLVASAIKTRGDGVKWFTNSKTITITNKQGGASMDIAQKFSELKTTLGLPETAGPDEVIGLVKKMAELMAAMPGAPGEGMPTPEQMPGMESEMKAAINSHSILTDIASELKTDADKVLPTVKALNTRASGSDDQTNRLAELEAKIKENELTELIASNHDRIPPAERDEYAAFARKHGVEVARFSISKLPALPVEKKTTETPKTNEPTEEFYAFTLKANPGMTRERAKEHFLKLNKTEA
jgi:phage I-like protein